MTENSFPMITYVSKLAIFLLYFFKKKKKEPETGIRIGLEMINWSSKKAHVLQEDISHYCKMLDLYL